MNVNHSWVEYVWSVTDNEYKTKDLGSNGERKMDGLVKINIGQAILSMVE